MVRTHERRAPLIGDPSGDLYGLPTYHWTLAPEGYATRRQLCALGLRKGGQDPAALLIGRGRLVAYLYRVDLAKPKFTLSPAKQAAVWTAARARQVCAECGRTGLGYIPQQGAPALGRCWTCMGYPEPDKPTAGCAECGDTLQVTCPECAGGCDWATPCLPCGGSGVLACAACQSG